MQLPPLHTISGSLIDVLKRLFQRCAFIKQHRLSLYQCNLANVFHILHKKLLYFVIPHTCATALTQRSASSSNSFWRLIHIAGTDNGVIDMDILAAYKERNERAAQRAPIGSKYFSLIVLLYIIFDFFDFIKL